MDDRDPLPQGRKEDIESNIKEKRVPPRGFRQSLIYKGFKFLFKRYELYALALLILVLETISVVLDLIGKSSWKLLLVAFVLSVIGFAINAYLCFKRRNTKAAKSLAQRQLEAVEIVFSGTQVVVTFCQFILKVSGVKKIYDVSIYLLAFSIISFAFFFKKDGDFTRISAEDWATDIAQSAKSDPFEMDDLNMASTEVLSEQDIANTSSGDMPIAAHKCSFAIKQMDMKSTQGLLKQNITDSESVTPACTGSAEMSYERAALPELRRRVKRNHLSEESDD